MQVSTGPEPQLVFYRVSADWVTFNVASSGRQIFFANQLACGSAAREDVLRVATMTIDAAIFISCYPVHVYVKGRADESFCRGVKIRTGRSQNPTLPISPAHATCHLAYEQ
jgi:hypothetical protein